MSLVPSELTLTEPTLGNVFNILTSDKGVYIQTLASTDNINILTSDANPLNALIFNAPITKLTTDNLYIEGKTSGSSYTLPTTQPTDNSVIKFMSNGESEFVPIGGGGSTDAFINSQPLTVPPAGSILIADGDNAFNSHPASGVYIDNDGLRLYGTGLQVVSVVGCDTRLSQDNDCNFNITNNSNGNIKLKCGGVLQVQGSAGGIYSLPDVNFSGPNEGDIVSFHSDGTSEFIANGGGGGAVNAVLNTAYPTPATAGSVLIMNGGDAVSSSPTDKIIVDPDFVTVTAVGLTIRGDTVSGTSTIISELVGEFVIANKAPNGTMLLTTDGNISLESQANIDLNTANVNINKVDPKLNFNNSDYPTQQCNISFQSATQELVMEHHTPDLASKCNIRLGVNDINIQSTFTPLNTGNINLITQNGFVNINEYNLPNVKPTTDGQLLSCNISGESSWITPALPPGLLRAINCNLYTPTEIVDVVWSNLTPAEQLAWKGGDPAIIDPVQSATGNYWNFTKAAPSTNKIGWTIPDDLSALSFQDLQSFWVVIRFNNTTNISTEGALYLSIQTNPPTGLNTFRTRWNYSNPATAMNQTGYFYKLYALDTITTTTLANFGKGQETDQTQFKNNPCNVSPELWSIALNKQVLSPTGDTTAGYTTAPIQSISLQTASNIHTFNFDVVSIGYLNKQYNLQFA